MIRCEQTPGQSVLQHGQSVAAYYRDLLGHLSVGQALHYEWKLPDWIVTYKEDLLLAQLPFDLVQTYQVYHDCGKPGVRIIDDEGRQHFPNHAQASAEAWLAVGGDEQVARLMAMDMDIHLLKGDGLEEFAGRPEAATLLLTGLCEVHSNAAMFGGIDSTSFKIKHKHLDRRGRALCKRMFG